MNGKYFSLELNGLNIDTTGQVHFYMSDSFPDKKWFHEVDITIKGANLLIQKHPVYFDSTHKKTYSSSDGGFLTYKGILTKVGHVYITTANLVDCDYIGFTFFQPPLISEDTSETVSTKSSSAVKTHPVGASNLVKFNGVNGIVYLPKEILRKDIIISPGKEGIWLNNQMYYRKK